MKRVIGLMALALIISFGQTATAQGFKFGHINTDELFQLMPERDTVIAQLQAKQTELQNTAEIMQVEFNNKYQQYVETGETLTKLVRQTKEEELAALQDRIGKFNQLAEEELQQVQYELMQPVLLKAEKAIKDVSKENGFTYVFDMARGPIIYFDPAKSENILPKVKAKLGIQ
jgi:outer membrane protein